jgi:ABC-type Na+ transport system ATPase subunit NatA
VTTDGRSVRVLDDGSNPGGAGLPDPRAAAPGISAHELTKRYGHVTVVDRLSFTARPGAITGFLGPNGAGKSTTLRMLLGLTTALAREGLDVVVRSDAALRITGADAAQVGRIAAVQGIALEELMTLRESLEDVFLRLTGETPEAAETERTTNEGRRVQ